jgi:hypothetical protein
MTDSELQGKVDQIKALVTQREQEEWQNAVSTTMTAALQSGAVGIPMPKREDYTSLVDAGSLFAAYLELPTVADCQHVIDLITAARRDLTLAWNELVTRLGPNSATWTGDAGDAFNRFTSRLTFASWEHTVLMSELERVYTTYRDLVRETRTAAHDFADKLIEALKNIGIHVELDWKALVNLVIAAAVVIATELDPPAGATALLITRVSTFGAGGMAAVDFFSTVGDDSLRDAYLSGITVRSLMNSAATAAGKLTAGVQAKGQVLADMFNATPGLIDQNRVDVIPVLPAG